MKIPPAAEAKQNAADVELKKPKKKNLLNLCSESGIIEREKFQSGADEMLSEGRKKKKRRRVKRQRRGRK